MCRREPLVLLGTASVLHQAAVSETLRAVEVFHAFIDRFAYCEAVNPSRASNDVLSQEHQRVTLQCLSSSRLLLCLSRHRQSHLV